MRFCRLPLLVLVLAFFSQEMVAEDSILVFMEGVNLSYASRHAEAQAKFERYRKAHPDDLLVYLRISYDRLFTKKERKLSSDEYKQLLAFVNEGVDKYERRQCKDTNLRVVAGDTLDCPYVGAALYSLRMTLRGENESWFRVGKDKDKFLLAVNDSHSLQALFLIGVTEYELSEQPWYAKMSAKRLAHLPVDHDHAVATILKSADGNWGPFADDIWFFIFKAECHCDDKPSKDGEGFAKVYPLKEVLRYLIAKYPQNVEVEKFLASKGKNF